MSSGTGQYKLSRDVWGRHGWHKERSYRTEHCMLKKKCVWRKSFRGFPVKRLTHAISARPSRPTLGAVAASHKEVVPGAPRPIVTALTILKHTATWKKVSRNRTTAVQETDHKTEDANTQVCCLSELRPRCPTSTDPLSCFIRFNSAKLISRRSTTFKTCGCFLK